MKHLHFNFLLAVLMSMAGAKAWAYSAEIDGIFYNFKGDEAEVTYRTYYNDNRTAYSGDVVIPPTVSYNDKTYWVTSIGYEAFKYCDNLSSITIPNSIKEIEQSSFEGCKKLQKVFITDIEAWCCINCYYPGWGGHQLYLNGEEVKDLVIPDGVTSIGHGAFGNCIGLTSVTIPESVTSIGIGVFDGCIGLTSVIIPNNVTSIGEYAFSNTPWFEGLPDGAVYIGKCLYQWKGNMPENTSVEIKEGTTTICTSAFDNCTGLTSVSIPNSVTSIGSSAFSGCTGLTSVTIPSSVTSIGSRAFINCSGLKEVHITDIAAWCRIRFDNGGCGSQIDYYSEEMSNPLYPCYRSDTHLFLNGEEVKDLVIPDGVTAIEAFSFVGCSGLTSVTIPSTVTSIGWGAFAYCPDLTTVTIPNSVTSIEAGLFYYCPKLNSVEIPNSVTSIGYYAFAGCSGLTSITIPNSVTTIAERAFEDCRGLTSVTIPQSVTSIGMDYYGNYFNTFYGCNSLTSVQVEEGNPVYDSRENCNAIIETAKNETVLCGSFSSLPSSVTRIGDYSVVSSPVTIPWSVNSIGSYHYIGSIEFIMNLNMNEISDWIGIDRISDTRVTCYFIDENGKDVSDLVIPEGATTIGSYIFKGASSLKSVTIPNSVTSIGNAAFADCNSIGEVKSYIEDLFGIPSDCFSSSVKQNATLYVPKEMRMFYKLFDGWKEFKNIVAMENSIEPVDSNDDINYGSDSNFDSNTDLNGTVISNIYYNISDDNGEYNSAEGCIVITQPMTDGAVENVAGLDINNEQLKDTFTGIIFMVQPGSGVITVNAETTGGMTLKVKIGDNPPTEIELDGKMKAKFPYSVDKASYVYIYAGGGSAGAKGVNKAASNNGELKIYGIEWSNSTDGIKEIIDERLKMNYSDVYNLNGQKVDGMPTKKGVYIKDGKKVLVK